MLLSAYPVGHKCGDWIVVSAELFGETPPSRQKQRCRCSRCNKVEKLIRLDRLNPNSVDSATCCRSCSKTDLDAAIHNLTGRKIGRWFVGKKIAGRPDTAHPNGRPAYECTCECDPTITHIVEAASLAREDGTRGCPNCRAVDRRIILPIGYQAGDWTLVSDKFVPGKGCLWRCKCGRTRYIEPFRFTSKKRVPESCRKCSNQRDKNPCWLGHGDIGKAEFERYRTWAKDRQSWGWKNNYEFELSIEYCWELWVKQDGYCALSGVQLTRKTRSLDRIDPSKGYVEANVQWVHKIINRMKWKLTQEEFLVRCAEVAEWQRNPKPLPRLTEDQLLEGMWSKEQRQGPFHSNWTGYKGLSGECWNHIATHAKHDFDLTREQVWELYVKQSGYCKFSGKLLKQRGSMVNGKKDKSWTASLDRIDSYGIYVIGNVAWVDKTLNMMKCKLHNVEFVEWCCKVSDYNYRKEINDDQ